MIMQAKEFVLGGGGHEAGRKGCPDKGAYFSPQSLAELIRTLTDQGYQVETLNATVTQLGKPAAEALGIDTFEDGSCYSKIFLNGASRGKGGPLGCNYLLEIANLFREDEHLELKSGYYHDKKHSYSWSEVAVKVTAGSTELVTSIEGFIKKAVIQSRFLHSSEIV